MTTTNESTAQCPHCRSAVTWQNVHGSKFLNREISNLQCKCNLCKDWIGNLSKLSDHQINECPDGLVDCEWKKYGCKLGEIKRKDIDKHNHEYKVEHLECKMNFLQNQHQTQIQNIKRKYEQQINGLNQTISQMNQEKIAIEKKWKQKMLSVHKRYNDGNNISINHIENLNISNSNTTTSSSTIHQTPNSSLTKMQVDNNNNNISYGSDGSINYEPSTTNNSNRGRRKRKRSVLDDFGSATSDDHGNDNNINQHNGKNTSSKIKKRRRMDNNKNNNHNHKNGSMLNSLLSINGNDNQGNNITLRRNQTTTTRKKKVRTQSTKKKKKRRRLASTDDDDIESSASDGH